MFHAAGEDDRLADPTAIGHSNAVVHQVSQDVAVRVFVVNSLVDFRLLELDRLRDLFVLVELLTLLGTHFRVLDAGSQELRRVRVDLKGNQIRRRVIDGLVKRVVRGWILIVTLEHSKGVAGEKIHRRGRQPDLVTVEVFKDLPITVVETAV